MFSRIRRVYRILTNRCLLCGTKRERHNRCYNCAYDTRFCHYCNKGLSFGTSYSIGKDLLFNELSK